MRKFKELIEGNETGREGIQQRSTYLIIPVLSKILGILVKAHLLNGKNLKSGFKREKLEQFALTN